MLRLFIFFVLLLIVSLKNIQAQTITISKSFPVSSRTNKFKIIGKNYQGYWIRNYGKNEERIDIYDEGMNMVRSKTLLIKRQNFSTVSYFLGNSSATIYYTEYRKRVLYFCAASINERLETGVEAVLDTIKYQGYDDNSTVSFASSSNKIFHVFFIPLFVEGQLSSVKMVGTNGSSLALYRKKIDLAINGFSASPEDAVVNNTGYTFLLIRYQSNTIDSAFYMTYVISERGILTRSFQTIFDKIVFTEPYIVFDERNQEYVATAFTCNSKREGASYFTTYRSSLADTGLSNTNHYKIDKQIISDIYNGDPGNIEGLFTFNIKKIVLTYDRGLYVLAESYFKENREELAPEVLNLSPMNNFQPAFNNTRSISTYHYNDILCLKINDSAKTFDYELLKKKQMSENDNGAFSSFAIVNTGESIRCLYNSEEGGMYSLVEKIIGKNIADQKSVLINEEKKGIQLVPKMAVQTGLKEIVMPSYRNDDFKLIKLKY